MAATVAGASPPARRSPRNGLPPSWSADEVYAHARAEWNNTDNALKEVPPSSWPWTMWANELHKSYAKKDGVAEAELQNLDTGTAERLGEELRRLVLAKAAVVRGGQLVDAFANAAAKPDAPAKRKLSVLENALTVLKAPKADDRARRRKVSSVKSSAARGPAASSTPCSRTAPWSLRRVQARSASSRCSATRLATSRRAPSRTTSRRR